jgi:hypothetical protein
VSTNQEQIGKLQGLLQRIQRNAARPRGGAPLPPPAAFAPPPPMPAEPPLAAAPTPVAPPAPIDQGVDDLLGADMSPVPVDVDVPLDTIPPVAAAAEPEAVQAEPLPPPPPVDDVFSLDSEVSEVRVATVSREPGPDVTVAAIEAEAEPIGTEELSEEDLVEVTESTPPPVTTDLDIDFEDEDEQPPASSQRSKVASSMDEALAAAAAQADAEREVPFKTPPPESGPQEAPAAPAMVAPAAPDVDALLGDELDIPTRAAAPAHTADFGPTPEQLGQTIDLEEARGPSLELAEHQQAATATSAPIEELEVALPGPGVAGGYDDGLQPPPEAREDLEAHRRRMEDDLAPPPESLATLPSVQPGPVAEIVPIEAPHVEEPPFIEAVPVVEPPPAIETAPLPPAMIGPEVVARPAAFGSPETFASVRQPFRPSTFVELLDASLSLGAE